jgi:cytochrome b subunit of formate dehydrogenase
MARHHTYYVLKLVRITAWPLLVLLAVFFVSGYALCGMYGCDKWISLQTSQVIHSALDLPLLALFLIHALPAIYLAMRRWRWIGR